MSLFAIMVEQCTKESWQRLSVENARKISISDVVDYQRRLDGIPASTQQLSKNINANPSTMRYWMSLLYRKGVVSRKKTKPGAPFIWSLKKEKSA